MLLVERFELGLVGQLGAEEKEVLHQIRGGKGRLAAIQDLEDDLRVVVVLEVDHDGLNKLSSASTTMSDRSPPMGEFMASRA